MCCTPASVGIHIDAFIGASLHQNATKITGISVSEGWLQPVTLYAATRLQNCLQLKNTVSIFPPTHQDRCFVTSVARRNLVTAVGHHRRFLSLAIAAILAQNDVNPRTGFHTNVHEKTKNTAGRGSA